MFKDKLERWRHDIEELAEEEPLDGGVRVEETSDEIDELVGFESELEHEDDVIKVNDPLR